MASFYRYRAHITVLPSGYGQWQITADFPGGEQVTGIHFTDAETIDDLNDHFDARRRCAAQKRIYDIAIAERRAEYGE